MKLQKRTVYFKKRQIKPLYSRHASALHTFLLINSLVNHSKQNLWPSKKKKKSDKIFNVKAGI